MLILARKVNESIIIGDQIVLSVVDIKGDQVKLGIQAPRNVKVYRQEVYEAIQEENRAAAMSAKTELPTIDIFEQKKGNKENKEDRESSG